MKRRGYQTVTLVARSVQAAGTLLVLAFVVGMWQPWSLAQGDPKAPRYRVDPSWPKPLPGTMDGNGVVRQWITGSVGASCLDSRGHVITFNRAYETVLKPGEGPLGPLSVPAPPASSTTPTATWSTAGGMPRSCPNGGTQTLPRGLHGCFVDSPGQHLDRRVPGRRRPEVDARRQEDAAADRPEGRLRRAERRSRRMRRTRRAGRPATTAARRS